ncbi:MAG: SGNH/GDSL hydrolase family protein [Deltaproteobacteria bacterium]
MVTKPSGRGSIFGKIAPYYRSFAVGFVNVVLLLVIINLIFSAVSSIPHRISPWAVAAKSGKPHIPLSDVYPGMTEQEAASLRAQTHRLHQEYDDFTQFRETAFASKYVNVSPLGFRPIKNQAAWPPTKRHPTVFVFGGSTTFGYGVKDDETIPSYLQELIREQTGTETQVYNFGRAYYFSSQERVLMEKLILEGVVPDVAIFIDGFNDLYSTDGVPTFTSNLRSFMAAGDVYAERELLRRVPVVKSFLEWTGKPASGKHGGTGVSTDRDLKTRTTVERVLTRYRRNMELIESIATRLQVIPLFVWQPVAAYRYDLRNHVYANFDYEKASPFLKPGYEAAAGMYARGRIGENFLWLADIQENLEKPLYVSPFHYSAEMCEIIARHICSAIIDAGPFRKQRDPMKSCRVYRRGGHGVVRLPTRSSHLRSGLWSRGEVISKERPEVIK